MLNEKLTKIININIITSSASFCCAPPSVQTCHKGVRSYSSKTAFFKSTVPHIYLNLPSISRKKTPSPPLVLHARCIFTSLYLSLHRIMLPHLNARVMALLANRKFSSCSLLHTDDGPPTGQPILCRQSLAQPKLPQTQKAPNDRGLGRRGNVGSH